MPIQTVLLSIDRVSTTVGKAAAWLLIALTVLVCDTVEDTDAVGHVVCDGLGEPDARPVMDVDDEIDAE